MTSTALLLLATLGLPLAMLLACLWQPLRDRMLPWLALAPVPGLAAAFLAERDQLLMFGNARLPLALELDRPAGLLLGVAALLWMAGGAYAATYQRDQPGRGRFAVCWLMTLTGCVGVFIAADMPGFYALLALLSVGTTGLVMQENTPRSTRAGAIYIGMALLAESLLLAGFVLIAASAPPGQGMLIRDAAASIVTSPWRDAIFALLIGGFGIKAGLVPLHFWIPLAHGAAPVPASALLSGAVVKASVIGLIRFMPIESTPWAVGAAVTAIGLVGALYAVAIGITQSHPKTVLAYSSVSQMGVVIAILGMGMATGDGSARLVAAFYASNHVLSKGALFLAVGVAAATGSRRLWWLLVPAAILSVGLGGLPLSGGALTKYAAKGLMGEGLAGVMATLSSIGTTLLMLHFLRRLKSFTSADREARAGFGLNGPWLLMALASLVVPWVLAARAPGYSLPDALAPAALWAALWPIGIGTALALLLARYWDARPRIPEGDVVVMLGPLGRAGAWLGGLAERADTALSHWALASVAVLAVALLFGAGLVIGR